LHDTEIMQDRRRRDKQVGLREGARTAFPSSTRARPDHRDILVDGSGELKAGLLHAILRQLGLTIRDL